jgi:hypothetical protein
MHGSGDRLSFIEHPVQELEKLPPPDRIFLPLVDQKSAEASDRIGTFGSPGQCGNPHCRFYSYGTRSSARFQKCRDIRRGELQYFGHSPEVAGDHNRTDHGRDVNQPAGRGFQLKIKKDTCRSPQNRPHVR